MLVSLGLLSFSLLCFWKHRGVSGARFWFHAAHAFSLACYSTRHALYLWGEGNNDDDPGAVLLVRCAYAAEAVLFTCAILHFDMLSNKQGSYSALSIVLHRFCWWFNYVWCGYNLVIVFLYFSCEHIGNSRIPCIQHKGGAQVDVLIRAIVWLGLGLLMILALGRWISIHKDMFRSVSSWVMVIGGSILTIGGCLSRGVQHYCWILKLLDVVCVGRCCGWSFAHIHSIRT